jgi:polysaccharide export outer membrane protein
MLRFEKGSMGALLLRGALLSPAIFFVMMLQGCAVVTTPGFDYADPATRTSITLGQYVPADAANPPQGVITPITPALLRGQAEARPRQVPSEIRDLFGTARPYTIGPSDIVSIIVYDHPELLPNASAVISQQADPTGISSAPGFIVDSTGMVFFPYAGRVRLGGLTESQAAEVVASRISKVIKEPQVTVRITSFRSLRAYVDGEVRLPGTQIFTDVPMTLPEAINRAGGVTATGDRSFVTLTRNDRTIAINLMQLQELGINPNRILLQNGDMVTVRNREENKVYVMGEILRPSALQMRNGRLSLSEALGEAGGPNLLTANTGQIYVIRGTADGAPAVFHLNASLPTALALADQFGLHPRDVVYIDPVPLVSWNRVVNLILPSAQTLNIGRQVLTP